MHASMSDLDKLMVTVCPVTTSDFVLHCRLLVSTTICIPAVSQNHNKYRSLPSCRYVNVSKFSPQFGEVPHACVYKLPCCILIIGPPV